MGIKTRERRESQTFTASRHCVQKQKKKAHFLVAFKFLLMIGSRPNFKKLQVYQLFL